jgi:uncharacterized protein YutE (UPF0331/DUF86 family)
MPSPGLEARVHRARYSLERLRRAAQTPWEEYVADRDLQDIVERNLHILLESILDLAAFIASHLQLARTPTYRGLVQTLIEENIIPKELARLALSVPGMRNILVHGYADVKPEIVYETITADLPDLEKLLNLLYTKARELDP